MLHLSRSNSVRFLATALLISILAAMPLAAQSTAIASVDGVVSDSTGKVIVGALITMSDVQKGTARTASTGVDGSYSFPGLPTGTYRMEVKSPGFKDYVQTNMVLQVGNNIQVNVTMQVGSVSERVEVTAAANLVETKENSISSVVDQQRINELPLNGRQPTQLIITLGAAAYGDSGDTGSKTFYSSTRISVAGGQSNGTAYLLDGGDNTDAMSNVNLPVPFPDALQEFSVETSAVSSRFGIHPGATVNAVTKSGGNEFHGDLFEYLRNGNLNARNFFAAKRDSLKRNQYGGTAGGHIIRDRLFYFGGYQGTRNRSNPPTSTTFIPTAQMLQGDFSTIASGACAGGSGKQLVDPLNGNAPIAGNKVSPTRLDPVSVKIAQTYLPVASADPCGKVSYGIPVTGDEDQFVGRIDFNWTPKHVIYGRLLVTAFKNPPTFDGKNLLTTTQAGNLEMAQGYTIGDNYTFGPGTLNSFHATVNRRRDNRGPTDIAINPTQLGINIYSAVPNFLLLSVTGGFSTFCGTCAPGHFNVTSYQFADDVDLIRGRHQIGFGFNLVRVQNNTISGFNENGNFAFNASRTGIGLADFMLGLPSNFTQTNATPDDLRNWIASIYIQDTFKVSPKFTLNYGVRWEPTFPTVDKYGRGSSFNQTALFAGQHSTVYPNAPAGLFFFGDKGIPKATWDGQKNNFGPRIGLVFNPHGDGRDTLRVGGALLYETNETWFDERKTTNAPIGTAIDAGVPQGGFDDPWRGYPGGNPFPTNGKAFFPPAFGTYVNFPLHPRSTYVVQWNVTYQRSLPGNWLASISYLGNKTTHLWSNNGEQNPAIFLGTGPCTIAGVNYSTCSTTSNTNQRRTFFQANPALGVGYASVNTMDDGAVAHYQGLLMSVQHRFSHGFQFNANYTDSYCISDTDFGAALATPANSRPFNRHADEGPCVFDTRHNFNMTMVAISSYHGANKFMNGLLTGWEFAPLFHAASGQPLNVTDGKDVSLTGLNQDRPNQLLADYKATNPICNNGTTACVQFLSTSAFAASTVPGTFGNLGHNALRGPGQVNFDVALSRTIKLTERYSLQARLDALNVFNFVNFVGAISPAGTVTGYTTLSTNLSSATFGRVQAAFDPRILQFSMKLRF